MGTFIVQIFCYFFIYAFLGWCAEVMFHTMITGKWVNRGFLNGPVCPIYGFGMLLILLVLDPLKKNIFLLFVGSVILTSGLEFITGWVLKNLFHLTWWDYSDRPFNIGGYICLEFSIMWGIAGVIIVEIIHPIIQRFIEALPFTVAIFFVILFSVILILDFISTLATLIGFQRDVRELERIGLGIRKLSDSLSHELSDVTKLADNKVEETREELQAKLELLEKQNAFLKKHILDKRFLGSHRFFSSLPKLHFTKHESLLVQLKDEFNKLRNDNK
ncbi:MAG: putative ABC transporter permease [Anaerorhabdus sp.]|uniref:putative ABC transporter permease n=1 Tax=Anaerorhabdus sp. TaxID=1872524 RepID=UPI003A8B9FC6